MTSKSFPTNLIAVLVFLALLIHIAKEGFLFGQWLRAL